MSIKTLLIATHNQGKVAEFDKLLDGLASNAPNAQARGIITLKSAADYDLPEPEETEKTFIGNALLKARAAFKATGVACLADDSGICVDALDGAPGIYSARWAKRPDDGVRDFNYAIARVQDEIKKINGIGIDGTQSAYFIAVLALVYTDTNGKVCEEVFEGRIDGDLCWPPRGDKGFGYDPMFIPEGQKLTFSEMEPTEKQDMSHRARAVAKFKNYLVKNA